MKINIGIFAHNEQSNIRNIIADIDGQSLSCDQQNEIKIFVLANGCTDATVAIATEAARHITSSQLTISVCDLPFAGKSRTWNFFVHDACEKDPCDAVIFVDADIRIREVDTFHKMISRLSSGPASVINSRPTKDIDIRKEPLSFSQKIIASSGGSFTDYKSTICGQLYAAKISAIRDIYLPIGLPVEDGFIKAMIISSFLTQADDKSKINGFEDIWHEYESIRSISGVIRHQKRIIVGSAINTAVFREITTHSQDLDERKAFLKSVSQESDWLNSIIKQQLPTLPYGYVPFHFLTKRQRGIFLRKDVGILKKVFLSISGFAFDLTVYISATFKLAQGKGAGFW